MKAIVDRFEGNIAVLEIENRKIINVERSKLPFNVREGDVLEISGDIVTIDINETKSRKKGIRKLMDELWE